MAKYKRKEVPRFTRGLVVADDVLLGILAYFPGSARQFQHNREQIHRFFYKLHEGHKHPVLDVFGFKTGNGFPESRELDQAYSNLQSSGLLGSWGHNFEDAGLEAYEFSPECATIFQGDVRRRFTGLGLQCLKDIAQEFYQEFYEKLKAA